MSSLSSHDHYRRIASSLTFHSQAFIDGDYTSGGSDVFENVNPATGEILGTVRDCSIQDVDRAVASARAVFKAGTWSRSAPEFRKEVLLKLAALVRENKEELAVLESVDSGKTIKDCLHEIGNEVPTFFQWYAEAIDKVFGKVVPTGETVASFIVKEPAGVVGLVLPWNFPLLMCAWKLAPALASGCSAIVKPAEQTPLTALRLAALATEAGVPPGVLSVLPGLGETTGQAIGRHSDIDIVSFTGSTEVGRHFLKYSSESNLKPIGLEMGGKSPFIILEDADITDNLVESAVNAAFWNGGQNCSANMRQIVHRKLKDEFLHKVIAKTKTMVVGNPLDPDTAIGAMVTQEHFERVRNYIEIGRGEGASLLHGGHSEGHDRGFFINPAVFEGVQGNMRIAQEEIFGPVLGVMEVASFEEALELALDTDYGLHATVFTKSIDKAFRLGRLLPCGTISINGFSEGDVKTPFGGYKRSGSLARDKGLEAMDQYLQTKTLWFSLS
ncbi:aldehyde dehydrogenase (NAD+)/gamma-glutamyl-gamma-aminobutyraldehyde dehydrogenase [Rhodoligotrophos appendicifer]|uniref:aldehyde dehydrogenase n=1 Tax=Rhodoligotrophos appendicifer TaxID=987056 RepID=UPI001185AE0B|nr:aldehyde dehydrogenase [Rhodoligotrophos appendicifer]